MTDGLRAISYGGGVQSTALLVLAARGVINFQLALMANVGDDSEHPATMAYVRDVAAPYAADHGIDLHVLNRVTKDGEVETLWGRMMREGSRSLPIPVRLSADGPPLSRACTADFKTRVTGRWLKTHGASKESPATIALGISLDEIQRANTSRAADHERIVYPLIGIGEDEAGLRLRRDDCMRIIADAGLPVPPKSSCFFCPFHRPDTWSELARDEPDLFNRAATLEEHLTATRAERGKGPVFLSRAGIPLRDAFNGNQADLFDDGGCDSGWCHT